MNLKPNVHIGNILCVSGDGDRRDWGTFCVSGDGDRRDRGTFCVSGEGDRRDGTFCVCLETATVEIGLGDRNV